MLHHKAEEIGGSACVPAPPGRDATGGRVRIATARCGPIPPHSVPSLDWIRYATDVYLDHVEPELVRRHGAVVLRADNSYHQIGLGTPERT